MGWFDLFNSTSENTTKNEQRNIAQTSTQKGTGLANVAGEHNQQETVSGHSVSGDNNRRVGSGRWGQTGSGNRRQETSGFGNAGALQGAGNVQEIGRGNAFQGADLSRTAVKGNLADIGSRSSIGGDLINRDYDLELVAEGGSKITFEQGDSGVSEAIADLGRSLGQTSTKSVVQLGDGLKRQQIGDISKELLFGIGALILGAIFLSRKK